MAASRSILMVPVLILDLEGIEKLLGVSLRGLGRSPDEVDVSPQSCMQTAKAQMSAEGQLRDLFSPPVNWWVGREVIHSGTGLKCKTAGRDEGALTVILKVQIAFSRGACASAGIQDVAESSRSVSPVQGRSSGADRPGVGSQSSQQQIQPAGEELNCSQGRVPMNQQ
eukprot:45487-Rhodomonas_salina.1